MWVQVGLLLRLLCRPGLGGLVGGWAGMTSSNPELSDSLSDSEIGWPLDGARFDFVNFTSFTGNRVSSNFTSQEISKCWWAASLCLLFLKYAPKLDNQRLGGVRYLA